jgi:hypothetical protein
MLACVALAVLNAQGYVRHLDTGDQAGFALGTFFLVGWFLPVAAVLLLVGAIGTASPKTQQEGRLWRGFEMAALIAGAAFFLAYGLWMALTFRPSSPSEAESLSGAAGMAALAAFSLNSVACALAVRPGAGAGRGLSGLFLAISAVAAFEMVAFIASGVSSGMLAIHLPFMVGPTLVWIAALLWGARLLYGKKAAASQGEPPR